MQTGQSELAEQKRDDNHSDIGWTSSVIQMLMGTAARRTYSSMKAGYKGSEGEIIAWEYNRPLKAACADTGT